MNESTPANQPMDWNQRYHEKNTPWNVNVPSQELARVLDDFSIEPSPMLELGCGTGTDALLLAQRGFSVVAIDIAPLAIDQAQRRFHEADVVVETAVADLFELPDLPGPYPFVFDRGVYHVVRKQDATRAVQILADLTAPGGYYLTLAGNANEIRPTEGGPPQVAAAELCNEFGPAFDLVQLQEFRFAAAEIGDQQTRPLGWSALWRRKGEHG